GRLDTVATAVEQAALGPDGTLYTVDEKRHVVTVTRRVRLAWPQPLAGVPRELFGADQRLVAVLAQDPPKMIAAAPDQPPATRTLPPGGDSAWVVDLPTRTLVGAVATSWSVELPAIGPDGSLLARQRNDLVAYRPDSLTEIGRVAGGGADLWTLTAWRPRGGYRPT